MIRMNFFNVFFNLREKRLEQLDIEEKIDEKLQKAFILCPDVVFSYIIKERKINRKYSRGVYTSSILDYKDSIEKSLKTVDETQQKALKMNHACRVCKDISDLRDEME